MAKTTVGSMSDWSGVLKDFFRQIHDGSVTLEQVVAFNEHRDPFTMVNPSDPVTLADWQKFYCDLFGLNCDFSSLRIPAKRKGFDRLIVVAEGMDSQRLYDKCAELFPSCKWTNDNLDKIVTSDRTAKDEVYAVWVRDRAEADEDFKNMSANEAKKRNFIGITLEERLVYELKFFGETGKHLDTRNITLCSGSRDAVGDVPHVYWYRGKMKVYRCHPDRANDHLRLREAVS
ncbi:MAG: hypothetical protein AAB494_01500 [Patescibacteria group bacterium]